MPRTLNEVIASLPGTERAKIEARARELIAEEMSLRDLRKAIGKTQAAIARFPGRLSVRLEELVTGLPRRKRDRRVAA